MTQPISRSEREHIWAVMSEFSVDNEIDYEGEAKRLSGFPIVSLKTIFFREVAPVCGPNLLTPALPVWAGFNLQEAVRKIDALMDRNRRLILAAFMYEAVVIFYRLRFHGIWRDVRAALQRVVTDSSVDSR